MSTAFDYESQKWVKGPRATELLIKQTKQELSLLESPDGAAYAALVGIKDREATIVNFHQILDKLYAEQAEQAAENLVSGG